MGHYSGPPKSLLRGTCNPKVMHPVLCAGLIKAGALLGTTKVEGNWPTTHDAENSGARSCHHSKPFLGSPISCISLPATSHLGRPLCCGKFVFPSRHLPLPILEVPCHVVNSCSHLTTCHFPSWTSPISYGKFVFPSHDLPLPILEVPSPVVNSSSHLIICHIPSWTSHLLWQVRLPMPLPILEVPCHVVNSSSHLIPYHFPSWTSHLLW